MPEYNNRQHSFFDLYTYAQDCFDVISIAQPGIPLSRLKQSACLIRYLFRAVLEARNKDVVFMQKKILAI
jgi:hypothetical protein